MFALKRTLALPNAMVLLAILCLSGLVTQAQEQATVVARNGEELRKNVKLWQEPEFPPIARMAHAGGPLEVELTIDEQGNVTSARIVYGHPLLQAALLKAARSWKFNPVTVNGHAVKVSGRMIYNFREPEPSPKEKTIGELQREVRKNPKSAKAHYALGEAYSESQRYPEAITEFLAVIRLDPKSAHARLQLGHAYAHNNSLDEAIVALKQASDLDPNLSEPLHALGLIYTKQEKFEEAITAFKKSLSREDPITSSYFMIGKCYFMLGRSQEAVAFYKQGLAKYSDSDYGHYGLGEVYLDLEQYSLAIIEFKEALRLSEGPGVTNTHYQLGLAYLRSGDRESAMREYETLRIRNIELAERLLQEIKLVKPREVGD